MEMNQLTERLSVSGQIKLADLKAIKAAGFSTIINNRPDGEAPRQPRSDTLSKRAKELGLTYHYIPVFPGKMSSEDVIKFGKVLEQDSGAVLAFCRTGTRSSNLWAQAVSEKMPVHTIISTAQQAGYDLSDIKTKPIKLATQNGACSTLKARNGVLGRIKMILTRLLKSQNK